MKEGLAIHLRMSLNTAGMAQWQELEALVGSVSLRDGRDIISWHLESLGSYSVHSMYQNCRNG
jgi:hypothetical protein